MRDSVTADAQPQGGIANPPAASNKLSRKFAVPRRPDRGPNRTSISTSAYICNIEKTTNAFLKKFAISPLTQLLVVSHNSLV